MLTEDGQSLGACDLFLQVSQLVHSPASIANQQNDRNGGTCGKCKLTLQERQVSTS